MTDSRASPAELYSPVSRLDTNYGLYAAGVLMVAYMFSFLDRQILNLMVGPIERSLAISDSQFALLTGGAFGIFYTLMGLPLGWMADRVNRKGLIAIGIACWSLMTATCGLASSYGQLMLARIGVGVGEASLSPSAYSMLSDYFEPARLPRAMSLYTCGIFLGAGIATILGGTLVSAIERTPLIYVPGLGVIHAWQVVFLIVGLPGFAIALWISTLREPVRRDHASSSSIATRASSSVAQGLSELVSFLVRYRWMCASLFLGSAFFSMLGYADAWYPELFIRTWGWTPQHAGWVNGTASLVAGPLGLLFAGWLSSRMIARGNSDACLRLTALGAIGVSAPAVLMPLAPHPLLMAAALLPIKFFVGFPPVLIPSAIQMVAPNRLRGQLGALFLFAVGIIGVSLGPVLPALFTDYVFRSHEALRYSLALSTGLIGPIAFTTLWLGLRQYRECFRDSHS